MLSGGYLPCPMLINQLDCVGGKRIVLNALILPCIVKLIKIAFDFPALPARQLDGIGKNAVAGLLFVKTIARMFKDYKPFKFFGAIALIFFILGLAVGIPVLVEFFNTHFITKVPSAILATGFMGLAAVAFQCAIILDTITRQHRENYELNLLRYEQIENLKK